MGFMLAAVLVANAHSFRFSRPIYICQIETARGGDTYRIFNSLRQLAIARVAAKALSTLTTIVADFGDYSRQCGRGLTATNFESSNKKGRNGC